MGSGKQTGQGYDVTSPAGFSLYERHHATVYRIALRVIGHPADAEECGGGETEHPPRYPAHFSEKV